MKVEKYYRLEEIDLTLILAQPIANHVVIPLYVGQNIAPVGKERTLLVPESEFDQDMEVLIPNKLGEDWALSCINQVQILIGSHYNKYGRITGADLELYLAELILVMSFIGETIRQPLSPQDKGNIFKGLFNAVCKEITVL